MRVEGFKAGKLMNPRDEASKGGMNVGRIKDPLYKDSYFGTTPPIFIPPFEAPENLTLELTARHRAVLDPSGLGGLTYDLIGP